MTEIKRDAPHLRPLFWSLTVSGVLFALLSLFLFTRIHFLFAHLSPLAAYAALFLFPLLALAGMVVAQVCMIRFRAVKLVIPAVASLLCLLLALFSVNPVTEARMKSDFLRNEKSFADQVTLLQEQSWVIADGKVTITPGEYALSDASLVPTGKARVFAVGENTSVYLFLTLSMPERLEGYLYCPDDIYPTAWDEEQLVEWSDPLDMAQNWYYICIYQ